MIYDVCAQKQCVLVAHCSINPQRACAARVTVLVPFNNYYVSLSVCLYIPRFLSLHAMKEQNSDTRKFVAATASF